MADNKALYLEGSFKNNDLILHGNFITYVSPESYEGNIEFTPSSEDQILNVKGKTLLQNITIKAIPYKEISNPKGTTVIIGGTQNGSE